MIIAEAKARPQHNAISARDLSHMIDVPEGEMVHLANQHRLPFESRPDGIWVKLRDVAAVARSVG